MRPSPCGCSFNTSTAMLFLAKADLAPERLAPLANNLHYLLFIQILQTLFIAFLPLGAVIDLTSQLATGGGNIVAASGANRHSVPVILQNVPKPAKGHFGDSVVLRSGERVKRN